MQERVGCQDKMRDRVKEYSEDLFVSRLAGKMNELSINQGKLAELSGVSQSAISRWLNRESDPKFPHVVAVARVLKCDIGWLAGDDESQASAQTPPNEDYVGPVTALEKAALTKTLTVLRSTELRGSPAQALAVTIDAHYESVKYAAELGHNGGTRQQRAGESPASSARRRKAR